MTHLPSDESFSELCVRLKDLFAGRIDKTRPTNLGSQQIIPLDDTTGWAELELTLTQLQRHVLNHETAQPLALFEQFPDEIFEFLISKSGVHMSRYIRQQSLSFSQKLIQKHFQKGAFSLHQQILSQDQPYLKTVLFDRICVILCEGLQDNWSEIRLPACHCARAFLLALSESDQDIYWRSLLPRLCLNRFYAAEGVRSYSLDTWRLVLGTRGRLLLERHFSAAVDHYTSMSRAQNHMVAEAACQVMAEAAARLDPSAVRPCLPLLFSSLMACLMEVSWPVKDAATAATGTLVRFFPEEALMYPVRVDADGSQTDYLSLCMSIWGDQLVDSIWSVRETAATAFGDALLAPSLVVRNRALREVIICVTKNLLRATEEATREEAVQKQRITNFLPNALLVSAARSAAAGVGKDGAEFPINRGEMHQTSGWGCCLDCASDRRRSPWEASAGAAVLVREVTRAALELKDADSYDQAQSAQSLLHPTTNYDVVTASVPSSSKRVSSESLLYLVTEEWLVSIWSLLSLNHFRECFKLHTSVLQTLSETYLHLAQISGTKKTASLLTTDRISVIKQ
jgi:hypothetical protein